MGDSEILKIEKENIVKRLEAVENHMERGEESRKVLMDGFTEIRRRIDSMENIMPKMEEMLKLADGIKWVLTKIFLAIITAVCLAMVPSVFGYISKIMQHG